MENDKFIKQKNKTDMKKKGSDNYFDEKLLEKLVDKKQDSEWNNDRNVSATDTGGDRINSFKILGPKKMPIVLNIGLKNFKSLLKKDHNNIVISSDDPKIRLPGEVFKKSSLKIETSLNKMMPKEIHIPHSEYKIPNMKINQMLQDQMTQKNSLHESKESRTTTHNIRNFGDTMELNKTAGRIQEGSKNLTGEDRASILNQVNGSTNNSLLQDMIALKNAQDALTNSRTGTKNIQNVEDRMRLNKMQERIQDGTKNYAGGDRTLILNQFNSSTNNFRTISKRIVNNEEHIYTSDAITRLIGEQNYQIVLAAISNNDQETKTRAICALLTECPPSRDSGTQTDLSERLSILRKKPRYQNVCFERAPPQRRRNTRRKTPYVVKDPPKNYSTPSTMKCSENKLDLRDKIENISQNSNEFNILDCNDDVPGCNALIEQASVCSKMTFSVTPSLSSHLHALNNLKPVLQKLTPNTPTTVIRQTLNVDTFGKKLQVNIGAHQNVCDTNSTNQSPPSHTEQLETSHQRSALKDDITDINPVQVGSLLKDIEGTTCKNISSSGQSLQNDRNLCNVSFNLVNSSNRPENDVNHVDSALMNKNAQVMWSSTMNAKNSAPIKINPISPQSDVNLQRCETNVIHNNTYSITQDIVTNDGENTTDCAENTIKTEQNITMDSASDAQGDQRSTSEISKPVEISGLDDPALLDKLKSEDPLNLVTLELMNILSDVDKAKLVKLQMEIDWMLCVETVDERYLPIHMAVLDENLPLLKRQCLALKARNESVDMGDVVDNLSALHIAARQARNLECVRILLDHHANPLERDDDDKTVLHHCNKPESEEHLNYIIWYMFRNAAQILQWADLMNDDLKNMDQEELGRYLLNYANGMDDISGFTPTMEMSRLGLHTHILTLLGQMSPEQAANAVNRRNRTSGNTALHLAVQAACTSNENDKSVIPEEYIKTIEVLLKFGADLNIENYSKISAISMICENEFPQGMSELLNTKLTEYQCDKNGNSNLETGKITYIQKNVSKRNTHVLDPSDAGSFENNSKDAIEPGPDPKVMKVFYKSTSNETLPKISCQVLKNLQSHSLMNRDEKIGSPENKSRGDNTKGTHEVVKDIEQVIEGFTLEKNEVSNSFSNMKSVSDFKKEVRQLNFTPVRSEQPKYIKMKKIVKIDMLSAHNRKRITEELRNENNIKFSENTTIPSKKNDSQASELKIPEQKCNKNINLTPSTNRTIQILSNIEIPKQLIDENAAKVKLLTPNVIRRKIQPLMSVEKNKDQIEKNCNKSIKILSNIKIPKKFDTLPSTQKENSDSIMSETKHVDIVHVPPSSTKKILSNIEITKKVDDQCSKSIMLEKRKIEVSPSHSKEILYNTEIQREVEILSPAEKENSHSIMLGEGKIDNVQVSPSFIKPIFSNMGIPKKVDDESSNSIMFESQNINNVEVSLSSSKQILPNSEMQERAGNLSALKQEKSNLNMVEKITNYNVDIFPSSSEQLLTNIDIPKKVDNGSLSPIVLKKETIDNLRVSPSIYKQILANIETQKKAKNLSSLQQENLNSTMVKKKILNNVENVNVSSSNTKEHANFPIVGKNEIMDNTAISRKEIFSDIMSKFFAKKKLKSTALKKKFDNFDVSSSRNHEIEVPKTLISKKNNEDLELQKEKLQLTDEIEENLVHNSQLNSKTHLTKKRTSLPNHEKHKQISEKSYKIDDVETVSKGIKNLPAITTKKFSPDVVEVIFGTTYIGETPSYSMATSKIVDNIVDQKENEQTTNILPSNTTKEIMRLSLCDKIESNANPNDDYIPELKREKVETLKGNSNVPHLFVKENPIVTLACDEVLSSSKVFEVKPKTVVCSRKSIENINFSSEIHNKKRQTFDDSLSSFVKEKSKQQTMAQECNDKSHIPSKVTLACDEVCSSSKVDGVKPETVLSTRRSINDTHKKQKKKRSIDEISKSLSEQINKEDVSDLSFVEEKSQLAKTSKEGIKTNIEPRKRLNSKDVLQIKFNETLTASKKRKLEDTSYKMKKKYDKIRKYTLRKNKFIPMSKSQSDDLNEVESDDDIYKPSKQTASKKVKFDVASNKKYNMKRRNDEIEKATTSEDKIITISESESDNSDEVENNDSHKPSTYSQRRNPSKASKKGAKKKLPRKKPSTRLKKTPERYSSTVKRIIGRRSTYI